LPLYGEAVVQAIKKPPVKAAAKQDPYVRLKKKTRTVCVGFNTGFEYNVYIQQGCIAAT